MNLDSFVLYGISAVAVKELHMVYYSVTVAMMTPENSSVEQIMDYLHTGECENGTHRTHNHSRQGCADNLGTLAAWLWLPCLHRV